MAWYKCIKTNQFNGKDVFTAGTHYEFDSVPSATFFTADDLGLAADRLKDDNVLSAQTDADGTMHIQNKIQYDKDITVGASITADALDTPESNRLLGTGLVDITLPGLAKATNSTATLSAGYGYMLDFSTPATPTLTKITWAAQTFTDDYVGTKLRTAVGVDSDGVVQIFEDELTAIERRTHIQIGYLTHIDGATITSASLGPDTAFDLTGKVNDIGHALGGVNYSGNVYSGYSSSDMQLEVDAGITYSTDRNYVNDKDSAGFNPHLAVSPITSFFEAYQDGSGGQTVGLGTVIESVKYDDGTGTLATMTDGFWRTDRIYRSVGTGSTTVVKGQVQHAGRNGALTGITTEKFDKLPGTSLLLLRGFLTVQKGCTGLDSSTAVFTPADNNGESVLNRSTDIDLAEIAIKDYSFTSQGVAAGKYYVGGFYHAPAADANLTQAGAAQIYGDTDNSLAAHAFIVAAAAGTATGGTGAVTITVTGTSITDAAVRTETDSETIVADITAMATDDYYESSKKWLGAVTFTVDVGATGHTAYAADFNYGLCKYEDFGNKNFMVRGFECIGLAGASDTSFNLSLRKHCSTGWTYSAAAFVPGNSVICDMNTDHGTEQNLVNGEYFAYKRSPLQEYIAGAALEGIIVEIDCGANNSVQSMDVHVGVVF